VGKKLGKRENFDKLFAEINYNKSGLKNVKIPKVKIHKGEYNPFCGPQNPQPWVFPPNAIKGRLHPKLLCQTNP